MAHTTHSEAEQNDEMKNREPKKGAAPKDLGSCIRDLQDGTGL